jgi:undecaprenyl-diphosphatase
MSHLLGPIISHLQAIIEHGGYSVLFLINVLEGIPVIGSFVPGHIAVIASGFLAKLHVFNPIAVVAIVILGAFIGDLIGYNIGKKYGYSFVEKFGKYLFITKEHIEKARAILNKHTAKTIILAKFSPITRPLASFLFGAGDVNAKRFWILDIIGVIIWSVVSIAIGYIFGASYHVVAPILGKFTVVAIVLALLMIFAYRFINKRFHIFAKYELITLFFNIAGLYLFFKTIQDALTDKGFMAGLDVWINVFFADHISSAGLVFMNIVTDILSPTFLSILMFIGFIYFLAKKRWRYATITIFSLGGGLILSALVKEIVMRARPLGEFILETGYSFPSGHAVMATIFFVLVIYIFSRKINSNIRRELFIVVAVLLIVLACVSRLYLGVHWASDVFAGIGLGVFWTTLMILVVRYVGMIVSSIKKVSYNL